MRKLSLRRPITVIARRDEGEHNTYNVRAHSLEGEACQGAGGSWSIDAYTAYTGGEKGDTVHGHALGDFVKDTVELVTELRELHGDPVSGKAVMEALWGLENRTPLKIFVPADNVDGVTG